MSYIDLMLMRTPGKKLAMYATRTKNALEGAGAVLPELERAGKSLPKAPMFGDAHGRAAVRSGFRSTASSFDTAASSAADFSFGHSYKTFSSVLSDAEWAHTKVNRLLRTHDVPRGIEREVQDATRYADDAVDELQSARWADEHMQRWAARDAADELRDGRHHMQDANREIQRLLQPYRAYDDARLGAEEGLDYAQTYARRGSGISKVSEKTRDLAATTLTRVEGARGDLIRMQPGDSAKGAIKGVQAARTSAEQTRGAALLEPRPPWFAAKVAAAYAGTAGVFGGTGYGIYRLSNSDY